MEEKIINNFFMSLYNDAIIFSRDKFEEKLQSTDYIKENSYILSVIHKINEIVERQDYPEYAINNLGKIIDYLGQKYKDNKYVDLARRKYNKLLDINCVEDVYEYEAMVKFCGLDYALLDKMDFNREFIEQSIVFDLITFKTLLNGSDNIDKNYLYIASLKKFFMEFPGIFLNKKINENAKKILNVNIDDEEAKRLMYKLNHIEKFTKNNFDYFRFKSLVDYIVIQDMLINRKEYQLNKNLVGKHKMESLYSIIEGNLLYKSKMRNNALEIMSNYKNDVILSLDQLEKKSELTTYYNALGKLNTYEDDKSIFVESEYINRLDKMEKIKAMFIPYDLEHLIENDMLVLIYLMTEKEKGIDYNNVHLTINKFLNIVPEMFDNPEIYERTMKLLKKKDIHTMITKNKVKSIYKR